MLAEIGVCYLHSSRREKQVKGSERTAHCNLARRTNQVNFQSHYTGGGKKIKITIKVIYWKLFCLTHLQYFFLKLQYILNV